MLSLQKRSDTSERRAGGYNSKGRWHPREERLTSSLSSFDDLEDLSFADALHLGDGNIPLSLRDR